MKLLSGSLRIGRVAALAALVIFLFSAVQFSAFAQEELEETYASDSGSYQISFPAGWLVEEDAAGAFITVDGSIDGDAILLLVFDPNTFTALTDGITDLTEASETITATNAAFSGAPEIFTVGSRDAAVTNAALEGLTGLSFTVEFDDGSFGFMVVFQEGTDLSIIEEHVQTVLAIVESYNVADAGGSTEEGSSGDLGGLLGGGNEDDGEEETEGAGGLGGLLGGGGGTSTDAEVGDTCGEFPLNTLNAYQYGIVDPDDGTPLLVYNIGCDGFMSYTIANSTTVIEYDITSDGVLSFQLSETVYTTTALDAEEWVVEASDGGSVALVRIDDNGTCEADFADLIRGTWVIGSGSDQIVFDFTCNGVLLVTLTGEVQAATYEFDDRSGDLSIDLDGEVLNLSDVTIDGDTMEAIDATNTRLIFTNSIESE